jgi:hypothetical protein
MHPFPPDLLTSLPEGSAQVAEQWWASLSDADRQRIAGLWDERLEVRFFVPQADISGHVDEWDQVLSVQGGRFVSSDDDGKAEWFPGYFEHLLQHPELVLAYEPPRRVFYICTQHTAARACTQAGAVPVGFVCPLGDVSCPLLPLRGASLNKRST